MFDTIGRDLDEESNRRRAQSLLISIVGMGAVVGFSVGLGVYTAAELVADDDLDDEPLVMIDLSEPALDAAPPALPPAPPKLRGVAADDDKPPEPTPDPDVTPTELAPPKPVPIADSAPTVGDPDGRDDGDPDGVDDGEPGGHPDGRRGGTGTGGGGPRVVHHRDLTLRASPKPRYPKTAAAMGLGEVHCKARVSIDDKGKPYEVVVEHCPKVFHEETRQALLRWRWYPPRDSERNKVRAQTVIGITYRPL